MSESDKKLIMNMLIQQCAAEYASKLEGKTFLYVYKDKFFEVYFAKECFKHLTGVNCGVTAETFYDVAKSGKLSPDMFSFGKNDMRTCMKKVKHLPDLYRLTITDTIVIENAKAKYMEFELGITDLKLTLLLHENTFLTNDNNEIMSDLLLPSSFRVGGDVLSKSNAYETIDCVMEKELRDTHYKKIVFRDDCFSVTHLPKKVKEKMSERLLAEEHAYEKVMDELQKEEMEQESEINLSEATMQNFTLGIESDIIPDYTDD